MPSATGANVAARHRELARQLREADVPREGPLPERTTKLLQTISEAMLQLAAILHDDGEESAKELATIYVVLAVYPDMIASRMPDAATHLAETLERLAGLWEKLKGDEFDADDDEEEPSDSGRGQGPVPGADHRPGG